MSGGQNTSVFGLLKGWGPGLIMAYLKQAVVLKAIVTPPIHFSNMSIFTFVSEDPMYVYGTLCNDQHCSQFLPPKFLL